MLTIHKLELCDLDNRVDMPQGAVILSAQEQRGAICVWYLCDPSQPPTTRRIRVSGTGWDLHSPPGRFIGTVQTDGGNLVWHIFEVLP